MAVKKALVVSSGGQVEELQSGDTLDVPTSSGAFYTAIELFGGFTSAQSEVSGSSPELVGTGVLDRDALPSTFVATFYVLSNVNSGSVSGDHDLDAINGGTTNLGTVSLSGDTTAEWRSTNVTSAISSLGSGQYELELLQDATGGIITIFKSVLIITG